MRLTAREQTGATSHGCSGQSDPIPTPARVKVIWVLVSESSSSTSEH